MSFLDNIASGANASVKKAVGDKLETASWMLGVDTNLGDEKNTLVTSYPVIIPVKPQIPIFKFNLDYWKRKVSDEFTLTRDFKEQGKHIISNYSYFLSDELIQNTILPNGFLSTLSQQFKAISVPELSTNIESTVTNLQKEVYSQPTFFTGHNGGTFSLSVRENLSMSNIKLMNAWYQYTRDVTRGFITPEDIMIRNNIVDYKTSIYIISTDSSLNRILYFAKYTGVFPTKVPSMNEFTDIENADKRKYDLEFSFDNYEHLNPIILTEINTLLKHTGIKITKDQFDYRVNLEELKRAINLNDISSRFSNAAFNYIEQQQRKIVRGSIGTIGDMF